MPLDDYDRMCAIDNLKRAYKWIQSNPEASYKSYFRDVYTAYAASSDINLKRLRKHLIRRAYDPGHASKVYLPKPSGILRPYTLLTINDQIVYQACINIVAEKLKVKIRDRYLRTTFGHLYAGKSSQFFYLKWQTGYRYFSNAVINYVEDGFHYVANFDLASFYDSIDHNVLKFFLKKLGIDDDLTDFLLRCLRTWTSSTWTNLSSVIYHSHGIPQGPLASGLLSEVVLRHIDDRGARRGPRTKGTRYLRYVDDIKLLAKSENILRQRLVSLDLASKEIGLFPQSSKINIRKVVDPIDEIKTVSRPPESAVAPAPNQYKIRKRLLELTRRGEVNLEDATRFKFLIARAAPHFSLNIRLIKVLKSQPAFSSQISSYFSRFEELPKKTAEAILQYIKGDEIYHSIHGALLFAVLDNMQEPHRSWCIDFCYRRLLKANRGLPPPQPTYKAALIAWNVSNNRLTYAELEKLLEEEIDWWVKKDVLKYIRKDRYGSASYEQLLNEIIRKRDVEPARIGALKMVDDEVNVHNPYKNANEAARLLLYAAEKIRRIGKPESMVGAVLSYVLDRRFPDFDWKRLFGMQHDAAELIAFTVKRNYESDINECIVTLDSLSDLLWEAIFIRELPGMGYGNYGAMLKNPALKAKYPKAFLGLYDLHQLRLQSVTAHPRNKKTGKPTRRLKHPDLYKIRPRLRDAVDEIINVLKV